MKAKRKYNNFRLLSGAEVDILKDGSLDISDDVLKVLDYVSISIHSGLKMTEEDMTKRILKAMDNPFVKALIIQWIEYKLAELEIEVRLLLRALK
jgi:DNA polymerase (family 10)